MTEEAQFERHRFDRVRGPKMVPKILPANLIFCVVFATLASQTVLAEAESIQKSSTTPAVRLQQNHPRRVGRMLFLIGKCALRHSGRHRTERC